MPKGLKNIQFTFSENDISHFGGFFLIHSFCKKMGIRKSIQERIKNRQRNQEYQTAEFILILLYIIILGIKRIENSKELQVNGLFKKIVGIGRLPDPTAIRRFLYRLTPGAIRQIVKVHNLIQKKVFIKLHKKTSVTFDIDGTIITVFGNQQRARYGYNPKRVKAKSYLAMLCFESDREFWYGSLYHGSVSQRKIGKHVIKKCLAKLPCPIYRVRLRADAGFYSSDFIENFLETESIEYTIEAYLGKERKIMLSRLERASYQHYKNGWEVAEFSYKTSRMKRMHRYIVQRRPLPDDPNEKVQLKLFEMKNYGYRLLITNLPLKPQHAWDFHSQRSQGAELNIKELKTNYSLARIPTKYFTANVAYLQIVLFAFNIINWFKWLCLPKNYHYATLQTIREDLLAIPARLAKTGNRNVLYLPASYQHKDLFNLALKNIEKLKEL